MWKYIRSTFNVVKRNQNKEKNEFIDNMVEMNFDNKGGCHDYIHNGKIKLFVNNI